ncbi:MAG: class I adenylate cyclase [Gammaproteobacteria bacterium]|nr:class I adenylate cyclase [Gammaproteobacteria bacterium]
MSECIQAFSEYNKGRKQNLYKTLNKQQVLVLEALPVLFHINLNLLPGYVNKFTPRGIFDYYPENKIVEFIQRLNVNFSLHHIEEINSYEIESMFLQQGMINNQTILWIIHDQSIAYDAIKLLEHKAHIVEQWLERFNLDINCKVSSAENIARHSYDTEASDFHIDKSFFLDIFYTESILIAGKIPQWWLDPEDQNNNIEEGSINLGNINSIRPQDFLSAAIWCLYNSDISPESYWLQLLLVYDRNRKHPKSDTIASRLKNMVLTTDTPETIHPEDIIPEFINEIFESSKNLFNRNQVNQILRVICQYIIPENKQDSIYHKLLNLRIDDQTIYAQRYPDTHIFILNMENLYRAISNIYTHIENHIIKNDPDLYKRISGLEIISRNLLSRFKDKKNKIPLFNNRANPLFIEDKITIIHNVDNNQQKEWAIVRINQNNQPVKIESFDDLFSLVIWSVMNNFINKNTQVSAYCPRLLVRQTDIIDIINVIFDQIYTSDRHISIDTFSNSPTVNKSIFLLYSSEYLDISLVKRRSFKPDHQNNRKLLRFIEIQLNNWGEIFIHHHQGMDSLLHTIFKTIAEIPAKGCAAPEFNISIHGIIHGELKKTAKLTRNLIDNISDFFYNRRKVNGKYIFKRDNIYYMIENISKVMCLLQLGNYHQLIKYLEERNSFSSHLYLEPESFINSPIPLILSQNKRRTIQLFFQITNNIADVYIADEHNSLHIHSQPYFDKQCFINQWLLFFLNTQNRLGKIHTSERRSAGIEISEIMINQNNELMVVPIDIEIPPPLDKCYNIKIEVKGEPTDRQLSLMFNEQKFSSKDYGERIFSEFINYFKLHSPLTGRYPLYLTDIDAPVEMFQVKNQDDIHMVNFIKYKRNIENRLNQLARKAN